MSMHESCTILGVSEADILKDKEVVAMTHQINVCRQPIQILLSLGSSQWWEFAGTDIATSFSAATQIKADLPVVRYFLFC